MSIMYWPCKFSSGVQATGSISTCRFWPTSWPSSHCGERAALPVLALSREATSPRRSQH